MNKSKSKTKSSLTSLKHGKIGVVDRQKMEVGRKAGHQLHESIVDDSIGVVVPAGQDASLRRSQEELENRGIVSKISGTKLD